MWNFVTRLFTGKEEVEKEEEFTFTSPRTPTSISMYDCPSLSAVSLPETMQPRNVPPQIVPQEYMDLIKEMMGMIRDLHSQNLVLSEELRQTERHAVKLATQQFYSSNKGRRLMIEGWQEDSRDNPLVLMKSILDTDVKEFSRHLGCIDNESKNNLVSALKSLTQAVEESLGIQDKNSLLDLIQTL